MPERGDGSGTTALHRAAEHWARQRSSLRREPLVISTLLAVRADANAEDDSGKTPLHFATLSVKSHQVAGPTPTPDVQHNAAVTALLEAGSEPNARDEMGRTPLHLAASREHVIGSVGRSDQVYDERVVTALLEAGANACSRDRSGLTPLCYATDAGLDAVVTALIQAGADPNLMGDQGRTPLHRAAKEGRDGVVTALLQWGADPNVMDDQGSAPLHLAAMERGDGSVTAMLSNGADRNVADGRGLTPLHWAAAYGRRENPSLPTCPRHRHPERFVHRTPKPQPLPQGLDQPTGCGCDATACSEDPNRRCLNVVDRFRRLLTLAHPATRRAPRTISPRRT